MNTFQPFYIFSVERSELSAEENARRTEFVAAWLRKEGVHFVRVTGRYKGTPEAAFLVFDPAAGKLFSCRRHVMRIAGLYDQESVLYVDANRQAVLYSTEGGKLAELGTWKEVTPGCAATLEAVTQTADGRYWSATA